jgi:GxxExxY protein
MKPLLQHGGTETRRELIHSEITEQIIGAAIEVQKALGPGLLESVYEECPCHELSLRGLKFRRQVDLPVAYKGIHLTCGYKADLIVEEAVVVELKAVETMMTVHEAQLLTYLRVSGKHVGLLINFNVAVLRRGSWRRVL